MREGVRLYCEGKQIHLQVNGNARLSMLILGLSRFGKTFWASCLGRELINEGDSVHLVDLGDKWSMEDKERLLSAGAVFHSVERDGIIFLFQDEKEVCTCGRIIANALGFRSANAVKVLKKAFRRLLSVCGSDFSMKELRDHLENAEEDVPVENEWRQKVCGRLDCCDELLMIKFRVDKDREFSADSAIWDLSGMDDTSAQVAAYLLSYCLLCKQKRKFRQGMTTNRVFLIIDEFQTLDCDRKSIIGTCLTEGQKYGLFMILITQFLQGNFSDAVINQFKQGGFRFYFRLTGEEAAMVSRELAGNGKERNLLYKKIMQLPQGHCLLIGRHYLKDASCICETYRFVEIKDM